MRVVRALNSFLKHAKKVVYDSPGLVIFVLNLPVGKCCFFEGEIQITGGL